MILNYLSKQSYAVAAALILTFFASGFQNVATANQDPAVTNIINQAVADRNYRNIYQDTIVSSLQGIHQIFSGLNNGAHPKSQCFNRAHVWANDMFLQNQINSMKVFIFYTKRYRSEIDPKWDFHVAPLVRAYDQETKNYKGMVLDRTFMNNAVPVSEWANEFSHNKPCVYVSSYPTQYKTDNQNYCYILVTPMYFLAPDEIKAVDVDGKICPRSFNEEEVKNCRRLFERPNWWRLW